MKKYWITICFFLALLCICSTPVARAEDDLYSAVADRVLAEFDIPPADDILSIPVQIGGRTYQFVVDTGSGITTVDPLIVENNQESSRQVEKVEVTDSAGRKVRLEKWVLPEIKIDPISIPAGLDCGVLDLAEFRAELDHDIRGVIGTDILKDYALQIDWDRRQLKLLTSGLWFDAEERQKWGWARIPCSIGDGGVPWIRLKVPHATAHRDFIVDTGLMGEVKLDGKTFDQAVGNGICRLYPLQAIGKAIGGPVKTPSGELRSISHSGINPQRINANRGIHNTVGLKYLSRFKVILDFKENSFWYTKSDTFDQNRDTNQSGLTIVRKENRFSVKHAQVNSVAADCGIQRGDTLVELNGIPVLQLELLGLQRALGKPGGHIKLLLHRGDEQWRVSFVLPDRLPPIQED